MQSGDPAAGRAMLSGLWDEVGDRGDALQRLSIAHWLADAQDDPAEELRWDRRALAAADDLRASAAAVDAPDGIDGLYPSLHLNLGDAYRRSGDAANARRQAILGLTAAAALGSEPEPTGYAAMIRGGLDRLLARLDAGDGDDDGQERQL